jgi:RHS repeat-associated protein
MGRPTQSIRPPSTPPDPAIQEPITTYDTQGRVKRITQPDDSTYTEFTFDKGGRRTRVRDPLGRITDFIHDPTYGRLERVRDAKLGETVYGYDLMSNLTSLVDPHGGSTSFEYDSHNRLEEVLQLEDQTWQTREIYTYDAAGRVKTRLDRRLVTTTYSYDGLSRLTSKTYTDGTPTATFQYDENGPDQKGRLTSAITGPITLRWTYDLAGRMLTAVRQKGASTRTLGYTYDLAGNRLTLALDGANILNYEWDPRGLLDFVTRAPARVFDFSYDNASRRKGLLFPNDALTSYSYDQRSRLSKIEALGQSLITQFTYPTHDLLGNRTSRGGVTAPAENYDYDELYRLLSVTRGIPPQTSETYTYDPAGNRRTSATVPSWTYNAQNRLMSNSVATFSYDFNGNLSSKVDGTGSWSYEWDGENRLKRVLKDGSEVASYIYDALGRRAERILSYVGAEYRRHIYVYDGEDIIREGFTNSFFEGSLLEGDRHIYVHGPGFDEPLEVEHGDGQVWYYHADGLGSIVRATDMNGIVVGSASRQYDSFGNHEVGGAEEGYAYTGREWDPETELYYYRARYYDFKIGRFLSEDPIGVADGPNRYTYVKNNPVNRTDPTGRVAWGGGMGWAGAYIPVPPGFGPIGDADAFVVGDDRGNTGVLVCLSGGLGAGMFVGAGGQYGGIVCPNCTTICDMASPFGQVQAGAAAGVGAMGGGGVALSWSNWSIQATAGLAGGAGAFFGGTAGGCTLVWTTKNCKCK